MTVRSARRRYLALTALRWLPVGAISPLLVLVMTERGLDLAAVGLVLVPYGLVVVALELPTGGLADAFGRRRVLLAASGVDVLAFTLFAFARTPLAFALAWACAGVARALHSGPLEAWYVDTVRAAGASGPAGEEVRRGLAGAGTAEALSLALGAVGGGLLPPLLGGLPDDPAAPLVPLSGPVLLAAGLALLHGATVALVLHEPPRRGPRGAPRPGVLRLVRDGAALAGRSGGIRRLLLAVAGVGVALVAFELYWQPRLVALLGLPAERATALLGPLLAGVYAAAGGGAALAPRVARLLGGPARGAVAGSAVHAAGLGLAGLARSPVLAGGCFLLAYLANGWHGVLHRDLLHARVDGDRRAVLLSVDSLSLQGGGLAAKLALAPVAGAFGVPWAWAGAAVVLLLCGLPVAALSPGCGAAGPPTPSRAGRTSGSSPSRSWAAPPRSRSRRGP